MQSEDTPLGQLLALCSTREGMLTILSHTGAIPRGSLFKHRRMFCRSFSRALSQHPAYGQRVSNPIPWLLACRIFEFKGLSIALYAGEPAFVESVSAGDFETREYLASLVEKGWSRSYIAAECRVSPDAIAVAFEVLDLADRKRGYKPPTLPSAENDFSTSYTPDDYATIASLKSKGWNYQEIGIVFGVLGQTIRNIIGRRAPVCLSRDSRAHASQEQPRYETWRNDAEAHLNDISSLAELWGVTYTGARSRLVRLGLDTQAMRDDQRDKWRLDLERCGSVYAAAKFWGIAYPSAAYRARRVGWEGHAR